MNKIKSIAAVQYFKTDRNTFRYASIFSWEVYAREAN